MAAASRGADAAPKLGLIVLGASAFPNYEPERALDQVSFRRSADAFRAAVAAPGRSVIGEVAVLDLFDSADKPPEQIEAIQTFLLAHAGIRNVIIYYCGHGWFLRDGRRSYALLLRSSHPAREPFTTLPFELTKHALEEQLVNKGLVLVLDCCFAGHAVSAFQSGTVGDAIEEQVFAAFPRSGTTLLLASSKDRPGIAPGGAEHTMFTGALVDVLEHGIPGDKPAMSLDDLLSAASAQITERWGGEAVPPDIQSPYKPHGDIARQPYFRNPAYRPPRPPGPSKAEKQTVRSAFIALRLDLPGARRGALDAIAELARVSPSPRLRHWMMRILRGKAQRDDSRGVTDHARRLLTELGERDVPQGTVPPTPLQRPPQAEKPKPTHPANANQPQPAATPPPRTRAKLDPAEEGRRAMALALAEIAEIERIYDAFPARQGEFRNVLRRKLVDSPFEAVRSRANSLLERYAAASEKAAKEAAARAQPPPGNPWQDVNPAPETTAKAAPEPKTKPSQKAETAGRTAPPKRKGFVAAVNRLPLLLRIPVWVIIAYLALLVGAGVISLLGMRP